MITPTAAQRKWHDQELGTFFHFDVSIYKQGWNWRSWKDMPTPDAYRPRMLNTDQWMEAVKAMGASYAIFVAKHCSGFLQWQSDLYPYGVKQSSWRNGKGDVVRDFVESCHKYGIKPGLYASVSANGFLEVDRGLVNRGKGGDDDKQRRYVKVCETMIEELWSRYGELFEVWFDGGAIPAADGGPDLIPMLKELQPNAIVFQGPPGTPNSIRWVGNERGVAPYPCWSTTNQEENDRYEGNVDGDLWIPGECDVPIRERQWFWRPGDESKIRSVDDLTDMYCKSVGRNCNLLLNANPNPDGLIPETDMRRYEEFGKEIRRLFFKPVAVTTGNGNLIELQLPRPQKIDQIMIMENLEFGERILKYVVEGMIGGEVWTELCNGESIGHKRIQRFTATEVAKVRLRTSIAKATPQIKEFSVFLTKNENCKS